MATGILIGNLGTPEAPTTDAVKKYLTEFLMDPRVINKAFLWRWILVNILIVPLRAAKSAAAYSTIWTDEGSPLFFNTQKLAAKLQSQMGADFKIEIGMRYGEPTIREGLKKLATCEKILLCPQYPQYALSSFESWMDVAKIALRELGLEKKTEVMDVFFDRPEYLAALENNLRNSLKNLVYEHLLFSFHGLPESHLKNLPAGKNYKEQSYFVADHVAQRLGLAKNMYSVSFQSRLGREPWIQPFTDHVIEELPKKGVKKLAVVMPSFTVDCLETLEEVHQRARAQFLAAGGAEFYPVSCLNSDDHWVGELIQMIKKSLAAPQSLHT